MVTVRYAQALPEINFNIAAPGEIANRKWAATDMNQHTRPAQPGYPTNGDRR